MCFEVKQVPVGTNLLSVGRNPLSVGLSSCPFALSLPFDRLRMIGTTPFGLSLSKPSRHWVGEPFDKLRANGVLAQGERGMVQGERGFVAHRARRGRT